MSRRACGRLGIALAGGGPLGGIYEIGALVALQEALIGVDLADLDVYVGVSSGAFIAAGLANGISPLEMHAMFILDASHHDPFEPNLLLRPAFAEFARRLRLAPTLIGAAARVQFEGRTGVFASLLQLTRVLPNGLFDNEPIAVYLKRLFGKPGRSDDFRKLERKLFVLATDLDSGRAAPFGAPGFDDVPISEAVKASSALPGLYPPARINGRDYIDGAAKKTLHASVALKEGVALLICVNPIVPFDSDLAASRNAQPRVQVAEGGLIGVLSQSFRTVVQARMQVGMERYGREFPQADVVLFEPARDDEVMFFSNMFSYAERRELCEHAYRHTRRELEARADELDFVLARHGARLDRAALADPERRLPGPADVAARNAAWDEFAQLDGALDRLERALADAERAGIFAGRRHAAKKAAADA
ncbi:MAG: patatin-like phospholipase family protein [Roseiarcus sp.]